MRKLVLIFGFLGLVLLCHAQVDNPVKWRFSINKVADKTFEIHLLAIIEEPWHIYSQNVPTGGIGFPTNVTWVKNPLVVLLGKPREVGELILKQEKSLGIDLKYYERQVEFVQMLKVKTNAKIKLNGGIEFMACTSSGCLPPASRSFGIILNN